MGKPRTTTFKVGWKGGPGRPKLPEDIKEFRSQVGATFAGILCELLTVNQSKLHQVHCSPDASMLEIIVARFLQQAANQGDVQRFSLLLDRFVGAIPKIELANASSEKDVSDLRLDRELLLKFFQQIKDEPDDEPCKLIRNLQPLP